MSDDDEYNKYVAMCFPVTVPIFYLWYKNSEDGLFAWTSDNAFGVVKYWWIIVVMGIFLATLIFFSSHQTRMPKYDLIFSLVGFVMSIIWINIICDYLMNFLNLIALISGLREDFLGMTLLAWGNSLGDLFANIALAKKGYGVLAVTGCFAGQLFNLLIGFGGALIVSTKDGQTIKFDLFNLNDFAQNGIKCVTMVFAAVNVVITLSYLIIKKFEVGKNYAKWLQFWYATFVLTAIGFQISLKM